MSQAVPELTRIVVAADGRIKANFSDNTILVLSTSGRVFVILQNGIQQRQLSEFTLSRHAAALAVVLEFRNMHVEQPYFCSRLMRAPREGLKLGFRMSELYWPASPEEAITKGLVHAFDDGKVALSTEDDAGRIVLHSHRRRFAICYPFLIRDLVQEGAFEYMWQTQVFSLLAYPARWEAAVSLVVQVAMHLEAEKGADQQQQWQLQQQQDHVHGLQTVPASSQAASRTETPHALGSGTQGIRDSCSAEGWWSEQTLSLMPENELIVLEWTPQATYQYHPAAKEVEVWVHSDESCLCTVNKGRFVAHHRPQPGGTSSEQLYAASCVPESVWSHGEGGRYALAPLAAHAVKLRQQMAAVPAPASALEGKTHTCCITGRPLMFCDAQRLSLSAAGLGGMGLLPCAAEETFAVASEAVVEEAHIPGQGTFTAYADGRLRARFEDRTILHMNAARTYCKVVLPDGASLLVATTQPVGVEAYVRAGLAFMAWALKPHEGHAADMHMQMCVQAELNNVQRMSRMLEWTASKPQAQLRQTREAPPSSGSTPHGQQVAIMEASMQPGGHMAAPPYSPGDIDAMLRRNQELVNKL